VANNYLNFSEVLPRLTAEEEQWLEHQLEVVSVFGDREFAEGEDIPDDVEGEEWNGCRAYRDMPDYDADYGDGPGFEYAFETDSDSDGWGRHLWVYAEEGACLDRLSHLIKKFLKQFRPDQCWSLTYATSCSKPRVGEFGGGALFVTADEILWQNAYDFIEQQHAAFKQRRATKQEKGKYDKKDKPKA
jgi:hypothetical protein